MPCANCGKTYEEHQSGLAYRDFTGAGTECSGYKEMAGVALPHLRRICHKCGAVTKYYENFDLCLKCEAGEKR